MAIYHLSAKPISRAQGRSATGAAAYRAGVEITDERTGLVHDYTRKGGVLHAELVLPGGGSADRAEFWNRLEAHHKRGDAVLVREVEISLPTELSTEQRQALAVSYARELADRYGVAADLALHAPRTVTDRELEKNAVQHWEIDPDTGRRHNGNWHAHVMLSACHVAPDGTLGKKAVELDPIHCQRAKPQLENLVDRERARWAELVNAALERHGHEARIDHRSHAERGIEAEAQPSRHLGPHAHGFERRTGKPSRKRQDFEQEASERLARAREAGELERQGQALDRSILDLSGDLAAAKADRDQQQAAEASAALARARYAQALDRVTRETLATVPELLPVQAVKQALHQVRQEVQAEGRQIKPELDLAAIRRQVLAQPDNLRRLQQADSMDAQAQATLADVDSMGVLKRMVFDTKAMSEDAHRLQSAAQVERDQVLAAVEQSPELRAARQSNQQQEQTRRRILFTSDELREMQGRITEGQSLWQRPAHVYRLPETVTRVVDAARSMAPAAAQAMPPAEVQRMADRAAEVAWTAPASQQEYEVAQSRFVLPAEERQQQIEREAKRQKSRGFGR